MSTIESMRQCPNCGRYMMYNTTTGYFCPTCYTKPPVITTSLSADRNIERIAAALESIAESLAALAQVEGEQEMNDIRVSVEIPGAFGADVDLRFDNDILIKQTWGITTDEAIALRDALLAKYPVERWEPVSEEYTDVWRCQVKPIYHHLQIHNEVTGGWEAVELPPTIRLCRLVETFQ